MLSTSISETTVQYRSAHTSVMTRIGPNPIWRPSLSSARNFWTIGRTCPGLQYMMSRTRNMKDLRCGYYETVVVTVTREGSPAAAHGHTVRAWSGYFVDK